MTVTFIAQVVFGNSFVLFTRFDYFSNVNTQYGKILTSSRYLEFTTGHARETQYSQNRTG